MDVDTFPAPLQIRVEAFRRHPTRSWRAVARRALAALVFAALDVRVKYRVRTVAALGAGPTIVQCNHVSYLDGLLIALASPVPLVFGVDTEFAERNALTRMGLRLLSWCGFGAVVPLGRARPTGLRLLLRSLEAGQSVMIFPEGAISATGAPAPAQPGLRWLAARSGCGVVRLQIEGAHLSRIFSKAGRRWRPAIRLLF